MKSCDYCGKQNEEALTFCAECGTDLSLPDLTPPPVPGAPHTLNVKNATIIWIVTFAAQVVGCILTLVVVSIFEPAQAKFSARVAELQTFMPVLFLAALIAGGAGMLATISKFKLQVKDTSPTGAAWVPGSWEAIIKGVGIGMLIFMASHILLHFSSHHPGYREFRLGISRVFYVIATVVLAPPLEEMLYRGVLFGGFCQSLGLDRAAIGTTAIFVLLHAPQLAIQPLATFGITAMAIAALWMRLSNRSIGPAIGVHFGFNALATLSVLIHR